MSLEGWKVTRNVIRTEIATKPLIEVSFMTSGGTQYDKFYFYEATKSFAGYETKEALSGPMPHSSFVVAQGLKPLSESN